MSRMEELEQKRSKLLTEFPTLGIFRRGSLAKRYLACGKGGCHCTESGSRGHGPKYSLTYKKMAKTETEYIPAERVKEVNAQLAEHRRFLRLCAELVTVSEEMSRLEISSRDVNKKKRHDKRGSMPERG